MPCHPARAREMLRKGRARIDGLNPFTIRLVDRTAADSAVQPVALKIDPGSKSTGFAVVRLEETVDADGVVARTDHVLHLMELAHRGQQIRKAMGQRSGYRRRRRSANLRYRAPRFDNRTKPDGWLAPSLRHRADTVEGWAKRYARLAPISRADMEAVRFDTHLLADPEVSGVGYQQGTLQGYEVREYLLERDGRRCAYCGAEHVPLQIEHVVAQARGGSDRVSNLVLSCGPCNQDKGCQPVERFLVGRPEVLARIRKQMKTPLTDAAAVNSTRNTVRRRLEALGFLVAGWSGGRTKFNRSRLGMPKSHCLDAACVGDVDRVLGWSVGVLEVRCTGRGDYQRTRVTAAGFPRGYLTRSKSVKGFRTGDLVRADVPSGKKRGVHVGRVAVRATGWFNVQTRAGTVQGVSYKHCRIVARCDGYGYSRRATPVDPATSNPNKEAALPPRPERRGLRAEA